MSSQDSRQQGRPWSEIDMESPEVQSDLGRWSQFGEQGDGGTGDDWATADDLVNTIVGAGVPKQQGQQPQQPRYQQQGQGNRQPGPQQAQWREQPEPEAMPSPEPHSSGSFPRPQSGMSEYGSWEAAGADGGFGHYPQGEDDEVDEETRWHSHGQRRHGGDHEERHPSHFEPGDKAGRKGRFTSVLALLLALLTVLVAISPLLLSQVDQGRWALALVASLPIATVVALPATLIGLRSASKPKGQLGRGRGIISIVMCSFALVASSVIVVTNVAGMLNSLNEAGRIAKEQTSNNTMSIVFPGGKVELSNAAIKTLMKAGVLPDNTLDQGSIPIISSGGKIYVGSREIDTELVSQVSGGPQEASKETLDKIIESMNALQKHGFSVTTDGENITIKNKRGSTTISVDELITSTGTSETAPQAGDETKAEEGGTAAAPAGQSDGQAQQADGATAASAPQEMPGAQPTQTQG